MVILPWKRADLLWSVKWIRRVWDEETAEQREKNKEENGSQLHDESVRRLTLVLSILILVEMVSVHPPCVRVSWNITWNNK